MRHARRTDSNHAAIREAFRAHGWSVDDLSHVGSGVPDLYVERIERKHGSTLVRSMFVEVKDGNKPPSARTLTDDEQWFHKILQRAGIQVQVIEHVAQVAHL